MDKIDLLNEKRNMFALILKLTRGFAVTGEDSDADNYADLIAKRQGCINKARDIDEALREAPTHDAGGEAELKREIAGIVRQIITLDEEIAEQVPDITDRIKARLKGISATRSISNSYHYGENSGSGLLFDAKN